MRNIKPEVPKVTNIVFVGTDEQTAKLSPSRGLQPPVFLTDVYPGIFSFQNSTGGKWGIISINQDALLQDMLAPAPFFLKTKKRTEKSILEFVCKHKSKWKKSLKECGVCVYLGYLSPIAIEKVMIFAPENNECITKMINGSQSFPWELNKKLHKYSYATNLSITKWLNGELVKGESFLGGNASHKEIADLDDKLANRTGLDLFYIKSDKERRK